MKVSRLTIVQSVLASALFGLALAQAGEEAQAAGPIIATGKLKIEIELTASKGLSDGAQIFADVDVYSSDASYYNYRDAFTRGKVVVSGGVAKATFFVPYEMTLTDRSAQIYVKTFFSVGEGIYNSNSSNYLQSIDLPADGAITTVHVVGAI